MGSRGLLSRGRRKEMKNKDSPLEPSLTEPVRGTSKCKRDFAVRSTGKPFQGVHIYDLGLLNVRQSPSAIYQTRRDARLYSTPVEIQLKAYNSLLSSIDQM